MSTTALKRTFVVLVAVLVAASLVGAVGQDPASGDGGGDDTECDAQATVESALNDLGFDSDELNFEGDFDLDLPGVSDAGESSFTDEAITTRQELSEFLNADTDASEAVRGHIFKELPSSDEDRALSGEGWIGVQFLDPVVFAGNTAFVDGELVSAGHREVPTGEIWWFYTTEDCEILESVIIRAACGNPQGDLPEPKPEPEPEPTPEESPKCFDEDGNPTFEGEFCADPDSGPEQQDVQDNDPDHVGTTDGYEPGNAEEVVDQQEQDKEAVENGDQEWHEPTEYGQEADSESGQGGGDNSVVSEPGDDAEDNPDYDGSTPSQEGNEGVTNDANDDEAQTKASDDGNSDEQQDSNDDSTDSNSDETEGSGDGSDEGAASGDPGAP